MKLNELGPTLATAVDTLIKAKGEIETLVATLSNVEIPQDAQDALAALSAVAQGLDDIVPDGAPEPEPEEPEPAA